MRSTLIFEFDEEILEKIGNEKDETKLIFEKYKLNEFLKFQNVFSSKIVKNCISAIVSEEIMNLLHNDIAHFKFVTPTIVYWYTYEKLDL